MSAFTVKVLDSICREVCAERFSSWIDASRAAAKLAKTFKRVYVLDPQGKMTIWIDGYRIENAQQLEIPLPVAVIPKNRKVVAIHFNASAAAPAEQSSPIANQQ